MLAERQKLTTNPLTMSEGVNLQVQDVYVPLGLVERKKISKRQDDTSPERGSEIYQELEITQKFQNDEFLTQVFQQKNTPKSKGKRIAIIGEPGAGKTTLLQQIADYLSQESNQSIVIWVSLADLQGRDLEKYVLEVWLNAAIQKIGKAEVSKQIKQDFITQFKQVQVWLLLDGLDEMSVNSGNALTDIARQIRESGCINQARIVLTCRLNLWDGSSNALDNFDIYRTLEFSYPEQVERFIDKWFTAIAEPDRERGERLCNALKEPGKERIQDLVKNPLRLTLLCLNWQAREGKLPDTQAGFYQQLVDDFYKWKQDQFTTKVAQRQELNIKLGELAREAIDKEATRFRLRSEFVNQFLGEDEEDSLLRLALRLGWLNQVGLDIDRKPVYAFFHASFQEYFAATVINDWCFFLPKEHKTKPVKDKKYRVFEPQWKQIILFWCGLKYLPKDKNNGLDEKEKISKFQKEKDLFIQAIINFQDSCVKYRSKGFYGYRAYFLAAAVIAEFKDCHRADEIVKQVINFLKDDFWGLRQQASAALQETEYTKAIAPLLQLLVTSQKSLTRRLAAQTLEKIGMGNQKAIATLLQILVTSQENLTRRLSAQTLEKIGMGNQKAIATLLQILFTSSDEFTRRLAAQTLEKIGMGNQKAIATLLQILVTSPDEFTRRLAAESLGEIGFGDQKVITTLLPILVTSQDKITCTEAVYCLGKIVVGDQNAINTVLQFLGQTAQSLETRQSGYENLFYASLPFLVSSQDRPRCWQAAENLGEVIAEDKNGMYTLALCLVILHNENTDLQAVQNSGQIVAENNHAIGDLVQILDTSQDKFTRRWTAENLGKIDPGNQKAMDVLVQMLDISENEYTRWRAAESLGKIDPGNEKAINILVQLLGTSQDYSTRRELADSLKIIVTSNQHQFLVIRALSGYKLDSEEYELIWKYAQNMSYPDFYQAWHQPFWGTRILRSLTSNIRHILNELAN